MIASSHSADKKIYEIAKLTDDVKELRSAMSDSKTQLMQLKMESNVVKRMVEKDIAPSEIPPNKLIVKKSN
jgi:isopentenyl phosphate kinase